MIKARVAREVSLESCLEDVETRFLYNLPESELNKSERLFFQIEQAWWFYEDFYADKFDNIRHFKDLKSFAKAIFGHCQLLSRIHHKFDEMFEDFGAYKSEIPVCGCILLNTDLTKMALACDWGGKSWSFPRGKIDEGESSFECALRETLEETGFDARNYCNEENLLVTILNGKIFRLYIAPGVPENTVFVPLTRKEVSKVEFFKIDSLPKSTYSVIPFVPKLKRWISQQVKSRVRGSSTRSPARLSSKGSTRATSRSKKESARMQSPSPLPTIAEKGGSNLRSVSSSQKGGKAFDSRNGETFSEEMSSGKKGWGVTDMFKMNAKLTGRDYVYDGNPHSFGSTHPRFTDYRMRSDSENSGGAEPASGGGGGVSSNDAGASGNTGKVHHESTRLLSSLLGKGSSFGIGNSTPSLSRAVSAGDSDSSSTYAAPVVSTGALCGSKKRTFFDAEFRLNRMDIMALVDAQLGLQVS